MAALVAHSVSIRKRDNTCKSKQLDNCSDFGLEEQSYKPAIGTCLAQEDNRATADASVHVCMAQCVLKATPESRARARQPTCES